jgi:hypothetical protein
MGVLPLKAFLAPMKRRFPLAEPDGPRRFYTRHHLNLSVRKSPAEEIADWHIGENASEKPQ